ncbi:MAG: hypothetical protein ACTSU5_17930 [Promethearchaeota archaeon]
METPAFYSWGLASGYLRDSNYQRARDMGGLANLLDFSVSTPHQYHPLVNAEFKPSDLVGEELEMLKWGRKWMDGENLSPVELLALCRRLEDFNEPVALREVRFSVGGRRLAASEIDASSF